MIFCAQIQTPEIDKDFHANDDDDDDCYNELNLTNFVFSSPNLNRHVLREKE